LDLEGFSKKESMTVMFWASFCLWYIDIVLCDNYRFLGMRGIG